MFETKDFKKVQSEILCGEKVVGSIEAYLIDRRSWKSNFYLDCDSVSKELQLLSNVLFYATGRIRKQAWQEALSKEQIERASVLFILYPFDSKI